MVVLRSGRVSGCGEGETVRVGRGSCLGGSWGGVCCRVSVSRCFHVWGWRRDGGEGVGEAARNLRVEGVRGSEGWRQDAARLASEPSLGREAEAFREGRGAGAIPSGRGVEGVVMYHRRGITGFSGHWWRGLRLRWGWYSRSCLLERSVSQSGSGHTRWERSVNPWVQVRKVTAVHGDRRLMRRWCSPVRLVVPSKLFCTGEVMSLGCAGASASSGSTWYINGGADSWAHRLSHVGQDMEYVFLLLRSVRGQRR